jgi:DDE domain
VVTRFHRKHASRLLRGGQPVLRRDGDYADGIPPMSGAASRARDGVPLRMLDPAFCPGNRGPHASSSTSLSRPWHVDETYVRIGGGWRYLYRAVDVSGQTIDFLLSAERDLETARRFFRRALGRSDTSHPRTIITDRLVSYREAVRAMKRAGEIWRFPRHRRGRWLNNWSSRIAAG